MTRPRFGQLRLLTLAVAAASVFGVVMPSPARAATFTVTNTDDSGAGSLRQAVADANAAPGADTITFSVNGTIRLTTGAILVSGSLTIDGPGAANLTISGNRTSGILRFSSTLGTLTVQDLTLVDGAASSGGAMLNLGGTVSVSDTVFARNAASGGGGAIHNNSGTVTVANSTFSANSAFAGGAIENAGGGTLMVRNSTFSGNSGFPGGAISNLASTATIVNSTFSGNSAVVGGALYNLLSATIRVTNSTFSGNSASGSQGDALQNDGLTITVGNSILAGNPCQGPITDGGGNLDWPESSCPGVNADPRLSALADNGGPTQTMALGSGSAAIDAAVDAICPETDQRGVARPQGASCDIGAYEADAVPDETPPVITVPDGITVDATSPSGAVVSYNASATDDVDGSVPVTCVPVSGSTFPIGTTSVTCSAEDVAGNEASATFDVHVRGAGEQLEQLIAFVTSLGPGTSLEDKLDAAAAALQAGDIEEACEKLGALSNQAQAQSGKTLTPEQADELIAGANRIRAALDC